MKDDFRICEVVITPPPVKENDQTSIEIGFKKVEGKGKLKFHGKFIDDNDDYDKSMNGEKGKT